jgi:hypothetical protein
VKINLNSIATSVIPVKELELNIPLYDDSIIQTLKSSSYAAIFTESKNSSQYSKKDLEGQTYENGKVK